MSPQGILRRVFIVGVPRSGTTLLQSLLAAHSEVTSFTESHLFAQHFTLLRGLSDPILTRDPSQRVHEFLAENNEAPGDAARWFTVNGRRSLRSRLLLPFQTRSVARQLLRVLDELALARGMPNWLEKTPRHLRYIPFLEQVSDTGPRTHFIHVIRQGPAVVASLHEASSGWEKAYDLESCIARWNSDLAFSLSRIQAPNDHFVFYEELASAPEATLVRLLAELGLPWEPEILERYGASAETLTTSEEEWKEDVGRRIRPSETWRQKLTSEQRGQITRWLQENLYQELVEGAAQRSGQTGSF